jgi:hypothetical protein
LLDPPAVVSHVLPSNTKDGEICSCPDVAACVFCKTKPSALVVPIFELFAVTTLEAYFKLAELVIKLLPSPKAICVDVSVGVAAEDDNVPPLNASPDPTVISSITPVPDVLLPISFPVLIDVLIAK